MQSEKIGLQFVIEPADDVWRWSTFDRAGLPRRSGLAGSKREAAAFVIREILRASLAAETPAPVEEQREAA